MYTGTLWLDFENEDEESHYSAKITSCIFREDELAIEFSGIDEGHKFSGTCSLKRQGNTFFGTGSFLYAGKSSVASTVSVELEKSGPDVSLYGTWRDEGDVESYKLEAELRESESVKG